MKILPNFFNMGRFVTVTEDSRQLYTNEVEPLYVQADIKYPGTSSDSNSAQRV